MTGKPADHRCSQCLKPQSLCVCGDLTRVDNRLSVLILQHPQEQDVELGTARLAVQSLRNATLKVGLSWPNLAQALGRPADPKRWAVLYLGSASVAAEAPGRPVVFVDRKGRVVADQSGGWAGLEGVIALDGSWSQAKALWWRNPWLLKCRRVVLGPSRPSRYGKLRKEPRRDSLATIESIGLLLAALENRPEIDALLGANFERLLAKYRAADADERHAAQHA